MRILRMIALAFVLIGAVTLGLLGLFNFNIVAAMFGDATILTRILYALVGISAVILMITHDNEECYCDCGERNY